MCVLALPVSGPSFRQVCESSLNTLVNLRGKMSFVAEKGTAGQQRLTNGKDGGSIEVCKHTKPAPAGVAQQSEKGIILREHSSVSR